MTRISWLPLVLAAACAGPSDPARVLPMALSELCDAIVWKHQPAAARFVTARDGGRLLAHLQRAAAGLNFVEAEPVAVNVEAGGVKAVCTVRYAWYAESDLQVRTGYEAQEWMRVNGSWQLVAVRAPQDPELPLSPFVASPGAKTPGGPEGAGPGGRDDP